GVKTDSVGSAKSAPNATTPVSADTPVSAESAESPVTADTIAILDVPVKRAGRKRTVDPKADEILGSLLDALPEPKAPGTGRARTSRRASLAATNEATDPAARAD